MEMSNLLPLWVLYWHDLSLIPFSKVAPEETKQTISSSTPHQLFYTSILYWSSVSEQFHLLPPSQTPPSVHTLWQEPRWRRSRCFPVQALDGKHRLYHRHASLYQKSTKCLRVSLPPNSKRSSFTAHSLLQKILQNIRSL